MLSLRRSVASGHSLSLSRLSHSLLSRSPLAALGVAAMLVLSACSSDGFEAPQMPADINNDAPAQVSAANTRPLNDSLILEDEGYAVVTVIPATELTVAYQQADLQNNVSADYVSRQWESMSACLDVAVSAPKVVIWADWLEQAPADDVLFSIIGRRIASYHFSDGTLDTLTVSAFDFDGSQGVAGFHLRSIIGRYLWSLSGRAARDYDTTCAS